VKVNMIQNLRKKLPLLNEELRRHKERKPLKNHKMLLIQHQLLDSIAQVAALIDLGVAPKDLFWIDIPYTSFPEIRSAVMNLGVPKENIWVHDYRLTLPYRSYQIGRVKYWVREIGSKFTGNEKLIVIDDGAYFLEAYSSINLRIPNVRIVEQSQSGIKYLRDSSILNRIEPKVSVINVAESKPKKYIETPMIVKAIGEALTEKIEKRIMVSTLNDNCLTLGYGSIGSVVAAAIPKRVGFLKTKSYVFDTSIEKQNLATEDGFPLWSPDDSNRRFKLVIGCSGYQSFSIKHRKNLDNGAFLVSTSTGSVELSSEEYIKAATSDHYPDIRFKKKTNLTQFSIHNDLEFKIGNRIVIFLNGGFPINFDGKRIDRIPLKDIQLTATLMVSGAIQAARANERDIIQLDKQFCERIINKFQMGTKIGALQTSLRRY